MSNGIRAEPKFLIVSHACVLIHVVLGPTLVLFNCCLWRTSAPTLIRTEEQVMVGDLVHLLFVQGDWEIKESHADLQEALQERAHQSARRHQHPAWLWPKGRTAMLQKPVTSFMTSQYTHTKCFQRVSALETHWPVTSYAFGESCSHPLSKRVTVFKNLKESRK
jgi:hypothetical protein